MGAQPGFFDVDHRMKRLSDLGDQLEAFGSAVDFEIFRGDLGTLAKKRSPKRSRNFGMIRFLLGEKTERSAH